MRFDQTSIPIVAVSVCLFSSLSASGEAVVSRSVHPAAVSTEGRHERIVQHIDTLLHQCWERAGVQPAGLASDGEFLRRAYLDLNGVIPRVSEVREFLADDQPDKRHRLVEHLLASPRYATHMATVWCNRILPLGVDSTRAREALGLQVWLRSRFARNLRYDSLVGGLLLTTGGEELGPALYFQVNDLAPEKLAASCSELFLGVQLQCAQCHDHPYADWSQSDFWGLAAFFAQVQAPEERGMGISYRLIDTNRGEVRLPDSDEIVAPKYLHGETDDDDGQQSRRAKLALWLTSRDNLFFARAGVNWAWAHFFGKGLVDSLDQVVEQESSSHGQLLDDLGDYFVDSGFDLQELLRTIASTRAYQLSSRYGQPELAPPDLFAHMLPKPLTPEQLYDSFMQLSPTAVPVKNRANDARGRSSSELPVDPLRIQFVRRMREPPGSATEYRAGTLQALMLMNGVAMAELTAHDRSRLLGALTAPFMGDEDQIDTLFLATLCRQPDSEERTMCLEALHDCKTKADRGRVLSDILWALVNSTEFAFNH